MNEVAEAELERMRIVHPDGQVESHLQATGQLLVLAPEKVLESVIGNLLRNAFAYTGKGRVTVLIEGSSVVIEDNGPGMEKDFLDNVFLPFFRDQRQSGGFGVGMTIVKRMSDRFGWTVDVASELGKGTRVTLNFPEARQLD